MTKETKIHKTAIVEDGAQLGAGVSIGPFSHIETDVIIGDNSVLGSHVTIMRYTSIGAGAEIHAGAVLGDVPQDTGFENTETFVRIGDNCIIREGVTIHRGTKEGTATIVGDKCFLMAFSHLAHNVMLGKEVIVANGALFGGYVEADDGAFISGNCVIHQFTKIGRLVMLGGGCGVSKDVPPFCLVAPLRPNMVAGLNLVGLKRAGFSPQDRVQVKQAFKILYQSGLNFPVAVQKIKETFADGPALEFVSFFDRSDRGICAMV
ncbi:MAG: acyl-ACP--UDP-N-acetylglucosamine O-acyltransferase [Kiritimatiellae bacterium]|nr:acyl-ACP--UDP-N-acetylglucosamine O-acyltransferase [Kiritimatiellia bacterium]